nr:hypothetical protein [Tanacetum cinerariifolium]
WNRPAFYDDDDDDDDEEESNSLKDNNFSELPSCSAVIPSEPVNSLIRTFLPFFTYPVTSPVLLSSGS